MSITILSMSMLVMPVQVGATVIAGDLIKMDGLSSVYYASLDGTTLKRFVFPNETTYFTWYTNWSTVHTVAQSELEAIPLGANITLRPGTKLAKITTNPTVYAVAPGGKLQSIVSEANAINLWGQNWSKRVVDIPDAFFVNYSVGSPLTEGIYPAGSLLKAQGSSDVYYYDGTQYRKFANEAAFLANREVFDNVVTAPAGYKMLPVGSEIVGAEEALTDTAEGASGAPYVTPGTGVSVALASDTPAAASVITDSTNGSTSAPAQALIPALKLNFTAAADGEVKVNTLKLHRTGISRDGNVNNAYLYDGDSPIAQLAQMTSLSNGILTFSNSNGLFTVPAGMTKSIMVRFDIAADVTGGQTMGFSLASAADVVATGATVSGSFPMNGNLMTAVDISGLGSAYFQVTSNSSTVDAGTTEFIAGHFKVQANSDDMQLQYLNFQMIGSATANDLQNIKLFADATQIGDTIQLANGRAIFDLRNNPLLIKSGVTKNLYIKVDIVNGSTRNFKFSLTQPSDTLVLDTAYNVYIQPYDNGSNSFTILSSTQVSINAGTMSVSRSLVSPVGNIALGATNVALGVFDAKATGENIKVSTLSVSCLCSSTTKAVTNLRILIDGSQVGSTYNPSGGFACNGTTQSFNLANYVFPSTKNLPISINADLPSVIGSTANFSSNDTITATLVAGSSNGIGQVSYTIINVPVNNVGANILTVKSGAVSVATNAGFSNANAYNSTGVGGQQNVPIASYTITAGSGEDVYLNMITMTTGSTTLGVGQNFQNLKVYNSTTQESIGATQVTQTSLGAVYNFVPTKSIMIKNGTTLVLGVNADVITSPATQAQQFPAVAVTSVTATGVITSSDASCVGAASATCGISSVAGLNGQQVYILANGSLIIQNVPGGSQVQSNQEYASSMDGSNVNKISLYKFQLQANDEDVNVSQVVINDAIVSSAYGATTSNGMPTTSLHNFTLWDGDTQIGGIAELTSTSTPTNGGYLNFSLGGSNYKVPEGVTKILTLKANVNDWKEMSSGSTHTFSLQSYPLQDGTTRAITARGAQSSALVSGPSSALTGNAAITRKSYPVVIRESVGNQLPNGNTSQLSLAKFKVNGTGDQISLKKISMNIALNDTTTGTPLTLQNFKLYRNGTQMQSGVEYNIYDGLGTGSTHILNNSGVTMTTATLNPGSGAPVSTSTIAVIVFGTAPNTTSTGEEIISSGQINTYELKADTANVNVAYGDADSVATQLLGDIVQTHPETGNLYLDSTTTYRDPVIYLAYGSGPTTADTSYFLWSDYSANVGEHGSTVGGLPTSSYDWTNGYEVRSSSGLPPVSYIPLDGWTLSKT